MTPDYAAGGIGQYGLVDLKAGAVDVLELVDGDWRQVLRLDEDNPRAEVSVDDHGTVSLDLARLLDT